MSLRRAVRATLLVVLAVGAATLAGGVADTDGSAGTVTPTPEGTAATAANATAGDGGATAEERAPTVVTTQGSAYTSATGSLVVYGAGGAVRYREARYQSYFDVDPVPGTRRTVEFVAARKLSGEDCADLGVDTCTRNVVERVNVSTGERRRVWSDRTPGFRNSRYHDVDRLNETHLVVADIHEDRVFVVDVRTDTITWEWRAEEHFSAGQGGPSDHWTHVNDVEVLPDGRIMVSVRNMDQVVFLRPGEGVVEEWTLGADDDQRTLFEQHNPDYIPRERGGPAVLVADSENNRVIEYHRRDSEAQGASGSRTQSGDGEWIATWRWADAQLRWPRDADRLPGGNTLVVDSNGDRVVEVTPAGRVVWRVTVELPYDAERLGTGDESAGPALDRPADRGTAGGSDRGPSPVGRALLAVADWLPSPLVNGLLFLAPPGVGVPELLGGAGLGATLLGWTALELRWAGVAVRPRVREAAERLRR